jgi:hypothetical protein
MHLATRMSTFKKTIILEALFAVMGWLASMQVNAMPIESLATVPTEDIIHQDVHATTTDDTAIVSTLGQQRLVPRLIRAGCRY